jgi:two-component system phosphate regulon sensor histidine kinase PhoR
MTPAPSTTGVPSRLRWWLVFTFLLALNVGWWVALQFQSDHATSWNYYFNLAYGLPYFSAGAALFLGVWGWRRERYSETAPLVLLGIRFVFYGIGQAVWTWYNVAANVTIPEFSGADVFYISAVLLEIAALTALLVHRFGKRRLTRAQAVLAGTGIVAVSFGLVYLLFRWLSAGEQTLFSLESFYSISSFVTVFLVILNLNRDRHGEMRLFWYAMLFATAASASADTLFAVRNTAGTYWNGDISDGLFAVAGILGFLAALRLPARIAHVSEEDVPGETASSLRVFLPVAVVFVGVLVAARIGSVQYDGRAAALDAQTRGRAVRVSQAFDAILAQEATEAAALSTLRLSGTAPGSDAFASFSSKLAAQLPIPGQPFALDAVGRVRFSGGILTPPDGSDFLADQDTAATLAHVIDAHAPGVSGPVRMHDGSPGLFVLVPAYDGGTYAGTTGVAVPLSPLMNQLAAFVIQGDVIITLGEDGRVVSPDGSAVLDPDGKVLFGDLTTVPTPSARSLDRDISQPVEGIGAGWTVDVAPSAAAREGVYTTSLGIFIVILLLMAATAMIVFLLVSQRVRIQEQLRAKTYTLRQTIADLKQSKFFLDNVSDTVVVLDTHQRQIYSNKATEKVFGSASVSHERAGWLFEEIGVAPEDVETALARHGKWDGEVHRKARHGDMFMSVSIRPLYDEADKQVATLALIRDITERKAIERTKTQFVSMVAHQLRTPMTQLRWIVEQMLEDKKMPKPTHDHLLELQKIVLAENNFVGDLLNVSRIERGVLKLETKAVKVSRLIDETVDPLKAPARERHIKIAVTGLADASVHVDEEKMTQALRNLVDNAIKYSPEWTQVSVSAVREAGHAIITVADQGKGIPEELWDNLYEIKTEISPGSTAASGSTGIGLYLTKKFVDAMGGTITFDTSPKGTKFHLRLPLA